MKEDFCEKCNAILKLTLTPTTPHYGRLDCPNCGFKGWARNPESPKNNTTSSLRIGKKDIKNVLDFHHIKKEICFFCLRERNQLGYSETLTKDHIVELCEGGKDEICNMQVLCSSCHKLKNWTRLYMNWHFRKGVKEEKEEHENTNNTGE